MQDRREPSISRAYLPLSPGSGWTQLAKTAWLESNKDENGILDLKVTSSGTGTGLRTRRYECAQAYLLREARRRLSQFLTEGRSFDRMGRILVIADSIENYNDELSKELTQLTQRQTRMRAIGFKPFIAPAYSSGAIS